MDRILFTAAIAMLLVLMIASAVQHADKHNYDDHITEQSTQIAS